MQQARLEILWQEKEAHMRFSYINTSLSKTATLEPTRQQLSTHYENIPDVMGTLQKDEGFRSNW